MAYPFSRTLVYPPARTYIYGKGFAPAFPTEEIGFPRYRYITQLRPRGSGQLYKKIYYYRHIYPPSYYQMWNYFSR